MKDFRQQPPPNQTSHKRFRGRLYIAVGQDDPGDDKAIQSMFVCADFFSACLMIRDAPGGDVLLAKPGEGGMFRDFLAGGEPPFPIPTGRYPKTMVTALATETEASKSSARTLIDRILRKSTGAGPQIYRDRALLPGIWGVNSPKKCAD